MNEEQCRDCQAWRENLRQNNEIRSLKIKIAELEAELHGFAKERDIK